MGEMAETYLNDQEQPLGYMRFVPDSKAYIAPLIYGGCILYLKRQVDKATHDIKSTAAHSVI